MDLIVLMNMTSADAKNAGNGNPKRIKTIMTPEEIRELLARREKKLNEVKLLIEAHRVLWLESPVNRWKHAQRANEYESQYMQLISDVAAIKFYLKTVHGSIITG